MCDAGIGGGAIVVRITRGASSELLVYTRRMIGGGSLDRWARRGAVRGLTGAPSDSDVLL